jgi:hypothetical protein
VHDPVVHVPSLSVCESIARDSDDSGSGQSTKMPGEGVVCTGDGSSLFRLFISLSFAPSLKVATRASYTTNTCCAVKRVIVDSCRVLGSVLSRHVYVSVSFLGHCPTTLLICQRAKEQRRAKDT